MHVAVGVWHKALSLRDVTLSDGDHIQALGDRSYPSVPYG